MTSTYFDDGIVRLVHGDAIEALRELDDESVDAVVTDPPYGLEFMGKEWDGADGFRRSLNPSDVGRDDVFGRTSAAAPEYRITPEYQQWCQAWAGECRRILKPGGHLLAFGGTRTVHRLAVAIEDAGFDIRDMLVWGYMQGFPKSLDISKAIDRSAGAERPVIGVAADHSLDGARRKSDGSDLEPHEGQGGHGYGPRWSTPITAPATDDARRWRGWGTALKPAWEPVVMARKPFSGTAVANVLTFGTGALNIDATRIPVDGERLDGGRISSSSDGWDRPYKRDADTRAAFIEAGAEKVARAEELGRWPANVILTDPIFDGDYPDEVVGGGTSESGFMAAGTSRNSQSVDYSPMPDVANLTDTYADAGGKSRFFLIPKADREERERGLSAMPKGMIGGRTRADGRQWDIPGSTLANNKPPRANTHPTVKPIDLMVHLVRLVTPPSGLVVDPFVGSGTTMLAVSELGFRGIGIDQSAEYLEFAKGRLIATPIGLGLTA